MMDSHNACSAGSERERFEQAWKMRPWITEDESDKDRAWRWWQAALASVEQHKLPSITAGSELADWSSLPRDLYVTSVKCTDGIVFDVQCCSVPMAIGPEVRYSLAEPTERCQDCGQELPLRYPCHEQGCTINCRF